MTQKEEKKLPSEVFKEISIENSQSLPSYHFPTIEKVIQSFKKPLFLHLTIPKRFKEINHSLYRLIHDSPPEAFLLSAILDFFERVNEQKVLNDPYDLVAFEFWLNHFSNLTVEENDGIRAKIVGKNLPREDYQSFFPIGMGKIYSGTHFCTAHLSPDIDTMMASFWGWLDSFGARVGSGLHIWCLPEGPPVTPVTTIFQNMIGPGVFKYLARTTATITLSAMDLLTQRNLKKEFGETILNTIDHGSEEKAMILINEKGHYLGDWRSADLEPVRQIIILFKSCLHWFENKLHTHLISLFAKENLSAKNLSSFYRSIFDVKMRGCGPVKDFNENQFTCLNAFFCKVLGVPEGLEGTFKDLNRALDRLKLSGMLNFEKEIESLSTSSIFDEKGNLKKTLPQIFLYLKELIKNLDEAIFSLRNYVERLDVLLNIKYRVLDIPFNYIFLRSDVEEMRQKMENNHFLTVVIQEHDGSLFPVGVVYQEDLKQKRLGTVSLRDFCNFEEARMASYLEVISVIDHHKSSLKTLSVPTALVGDTQSCNVLIAEQAFCLNDKYSLGGMTIQEIEKQWEENNSMTRTLSQMRLAKRLLQRLIASHQKEHFYIHPRREFLEYLCFLHAILDDTDLLTKVSKRDLVCIAQLLNRIKSLTLGREVEIIHFDDIPQNNEFVKRAAHRLLRQEDMYSLYKQVYVLKESEIEFNLRLCAQGKESTIFMDTKEQNGCARVGQTKLFSSNYGTFLANSAQIRQFWFNESRRVGREKPEIDLFIHMISTIPSAEQVYKNEMEPYSHQDELWFWSPSTRQGIHHLNNFLDGFQQGIKEFKKTIILEFSGSPTRKFIDIFSIHFPDIPQKVTPSHTENWIAILRFKAGALNSRKAMITPYIPRLL